MSEGTDKTEIEAAVFRRLLEHLDSRKDVQNIELMTLAGFCRNCLSKWYSAEAKTRGIEVDYESAREIVYGMPYDEWKDKYQQEATAEQLADWLGVSAASAAASAAALASAASAAAAAGTSGRPSEGRVNRAAVAHTRLRWNGVMPDPSRAAGSAPRCNRWATARSRP